MIIDLVKGRKKYLDSVIKDIKSKISDCPDGILKSSLKHNKDKNCYQYYVRKNRSDPSGKYLRQEDIGFAKKLAQKEYYGKVLIAAEKELKLLNYYCARSDENALVKAYTDMNYGKRILVEPYVLPDDEYARRWQAKKYEGGRFSENDPAIYTKRGERVRSKSEQIIADRLHDAGIPYRYEFPFIYEGNKVIHTDFTVLKKSTRDVFRWEHFGKMDDPKYRKTFFWKQSLYAQYGYVPGINIIYTFEDNDNPLDSRFLDRLIKKFFL